MFASTRRKTELPPRRLGDDSRQPSIHSQGRPQDNDSDKLFSFNQSNPTLDPNQNPLLARSSRIRSLEEELKTCRSRSSLWEKAKNEIMQLNTFFRLQAVSLQCSDSAIMKEFFEAVGELVKGKQGQSRRDELKAVEEKKKEKDLFEKLVESNKARYELEQRLLQKDHEITKISEINESLREKSRVQSTTRSSKISKIQEETFLTLQKEQLEERNVQLRQQVIRLDELATKYKAQVQEKEAELTQAIDKNEEMFLQLEMLKKTQGSQSEREELEKEVNKVSAEAQQWKKQLQDALEKVEEKKKEEEQTDEFLAKFKEEFERVAQENTSIRQELGRRGQIITTLKKVIEEAKKANENYSVQLKKQQEAEEAQKKESVAQLIQNEQKLRERLRSCSPRLGSPSRPRFNSPGRPRDPFATKEPREPRRQLTNNVTMRQQSNDFIVI